MNSSCSMQYVASQDRLYWSEGAKLRYITAPDVPTQHTLIDVFTASGTIENFTVSPDNKYIFYTKAGKLHCHAIALENESLICKNNPATHINLGPPAGLSTISRGPNQFTWKNNYTLYISTYSGEIFEYITYH